MTPTTIASKGQYGFTLTEIVIVMFGGLILLAIGVPVLNSTLDQYRLVLDAQNIASQLQFARMKAVSSNEPFRVDFPAGQDDYRVETIDLVSGNANLVSGPFFLSQGIQWNTVDTGTGVTFPGRFVVFLPTGNVQPTGNGSAGRVKLINRSQIRIDVVVDLGGTVRITPTFRNATPPF